MAKMAAIVSASQGGKKRARRIDRLTRTLPAVFLAFMIAQTCSAPPSGNWRERALLYADSQHMFGPLQLAGSTYSGSFVRFQFNSTTATIRDYIVLSPGRTTSVFQTVQSDAAAAGSTTLNGSFFEHSNSQVRISARNNPTSALIVRSISSQFNVTFTLSSGIDAERYGKSLNLSAQYFVGRLFVTGAANMSLVGFQAMVRLPPGSEAIFRVNSETGEDVAGRFGQSALFNATAQSSLALDSFEVGLEGYVEASDTEYDGVSRVTTNLTSNALQMTFNVGPGSAKLVALHLHNSVLAVDNQTKIIVRVDGMAITATASLDEVVGSQGTTPLYAFLVGTNGLLLLVRVPQSSLLVLDVVISTSTLGPQPLDIVQVAAIVAIILVLLGAAAAFMLRRKPRT